LDVFLDIDGQDARQVKLPKPGGDKYFLYCPHLLKRLQVRHCLDVRQDSGKRSFAKRMGCGAVRKYRTLTNLICHCE